MMTRKAITLLSGFGDNEQEAFGREQELNLEIPRIKRGNEMLFTRNTKRF